MFQQANRPGWVEVIAGVMFSGKSEELIRRVRRAVIARKQVQVFKSHLDARYAGLYNVSTHVGITVEAELVGDLDDAVVEELCLVDRDDLRGRADALHDLGGAVHGLGLDGDAVVRGDVEAE